MRVQHTIAEIGLSLEVMASWPLLSLNDVGAMGIYQAVGETSGIVFVRYGPDETLANYLAKLGGMLTQVALIGDETMTVSGREARRVTVRMVTPPRDIYRDEAGRGMTHGSLPEARTVLNVIAFGNRRIPILAGYRMPEESLGRYMQPLETILSSIRAY